MKNNMCVGFGVCVCMCVSLCVLVCVCVYVCVCVCERKRERERGGEREIMIVRSVFMLCVYRRFYKYQSSENISNKKQNNNLLLFLRTNDTCKLELFKQKERKRGEKESKKRVGRNEEKERS